jgi:hypothetical protein
LRTLHRHQLGKLRPALLEGRRVHIGDIVRNDFQPTLLTIQPRGADMKNPVHYSPLRLAERRDRAAHQFIVNHHQPLARLRLAQRGHDRHHFRP